MDKKDMQLKLLAQALYEIRQMLSHHISLDEAEKTREAISADIAYALHNEVLAVMEDRLEDFDLEEALKNIEAVDKAYGNDLLQRYKRMIVEE